MLMKSFTFNIFLHFFKLSYSFVIIHSGYIVYISWERTSFFNGGGRGDFSVGTSFLGGGHPIGNICFDKRGRSLKKIHRVEVDTLTSSLPTVMGWAPSPISAYCGPHTK